MSKGIVKKLLLIFIIIVCVGCKQASRVTKKQISEYFVNSPITVDVEINSSTEIPFNYESVNELNFLREGISEEQYYYKQLDWQQYIKDKFNINMTVAYKSIYTDSDKILRYISYSDLKARNNTYLFGHFDPQRSHDMTPYFVKYDWLSFIDTSYLDRIVKDGMIMAVPAVSDKYVLPRYYNENYLNQLNMNVPETVDEFMFYLSSVKRANLDKNNFYPILIPIDGLFQSTADIFRAYGAYVNPFINSTVGYNPETDTFEDSAFSENFERAVEYIRELQIKGLLGVYGTSKGIQLGNIEHNKFNDSLFKMDKEFASEYGYIYSKKDSSFKRDPERTPDYDYLQGYYLTNDSKTNICEVRSDISFYYFPKEIENLPGIVERFDEVMTNSKFHGDLMYGIKEVDYLVIDGKYKSNKPITGALMGFRQIKPTTKVDERVLPGSLDILSDLKDTEFYNINVFNDLITYAVDEIRFRLNEHHPYEVLFYENVSPSDAIAEYKKEFKIRGIYNYIIEINRGMDTVPVFDYGN